MKVSADKIIYLLIIIMMAGAVLFVSSLSKSEREANCCTGTKVDVLGERCYVSTDEIVKGIEENVGPVTGMRADSVKLAEIELVVDGISAVKKSQVWITEDGLLHVSVTQREPVLHFTGAHMDCYVDSEGCIFPRPEGCDAEVPCISGEMPIKLAQGFKGKAAGEEERGWIKNMLEVADYMEENSAIRGLVDSIRVKANGELVMSPAGNGPTVLFGQPENIASKFSRLNKYFNQVEPAKGTDHYRRVDLRYDGQLICTRYE